MHSSAIEILKYCYWILALAITSSLSCNSTKNAQSNFNVLQASALHPIGRYQLNRNNQLELISSAVHFSFRFEGTECRLYATNADTNGHNYMQYEMDGVYQKRVSIQGKQTQPVLLTASRPGTHLVTVYKATEAHTGAIYIHKIEGKKLKAVQSGSKPFIEFIGNSITCGAAADPSKVPCGTGQYHDQHNAYLAYGPSVARSLNADFMLSSVSGIGIYRNWNSDGPAMPAVYEKINFQLNEMKSWKFDTYAPRIVSIALGTNDLSNGDGIRDRLPFDSVHFVTNYIAFIKLVKAKYPRAKIILLSSPMAGGRNKLILESCLTAIKRETDSSFPPGERISLFFFKPMQARGCTGHPSVDDHAILAAELLPVFKALL